MKIYYHDPLAPQVWAECKALMQHIPHQELLANTTIYLGSNPRPHIRPTNRGYYSPALRHIVVTENGFYRNTTIGGDDFRVYHALRTLLHEIGHMIHFDFLPNYTAAKTSPGLWLEWAAATGYELRFEMGTFYGNTGVVVSYEQFANDFRDWVIAGPDWDIKRTTFYYGLWGQEVAEVPQTKLMDTEPILHNSRTMVPIRFVAEELGCRVDWDGSDRSVTITDERGRVVKMWIGRNEYVVKGG